MTDSIRYLYGNPKTTYSELVVAVQRAESEMEETKEKVKVRSAAATEMVSGSKELEAQTARLMAALTRAEQGICPASAPNSPRLRGCGRGQTDSNTPGLSKLPQWSDWPGPNHFRPQILNHQ